MVDRVFDSKFREYEDLRKQLPMFDQYRNKLEMTREALEIQVKQSYEKVSKLSKIRNESRYANGNAEFMRKRENKRKVRSREEMSAFHYRSGFNGWQEYQISKGVVPNSIPLDLWHIEVAEWNKCVLLSWSIKLQHVKIKEHEKDLQQLATAIEGIKTESQRVSSDEAFNQFIRNATPYLTTHERLCQQRDDTSWLQDPVERAAAFNSINERIDYLRIKFELEFCEKKLPKITRDAYLVYIEEKGAILDRAIKEAAPPETKSKEAKPIFCHAAPIGTGRVAKTIISTQKRLYDSLRKRERLSAYKCPDCGDFMILDLHTCIQSCECGYHRETMVTQHEYEDYDHGNVRVSKYTYERINHLREYFRHVQGLGRKEGLDVVLQTLRSEFERLNIPLGTVTDEMVRRRLRLLSQVTDDREYEKFFEHAVLLAAALNPTFKVLHIPKNDVEILVEFFLFIEEAFEEIRGEFPFRKNYMGYPYVIRQGCLMIGREAGPECEVFLEYAQSFKLLKTPSLLRVQDMIFKRICEVRGLRFARTVGNLDVSE